MEQRINIYNLTPKAYDGLFALENFIAECPLTKKQISLIKMYASQINGCAYCMDMHIKEALKAGETHERLHFLKVWKDVTVFTEEEKILLQITEEVTLIQRNGLTNATYQKASKFFDEITLSAIILCVTVINAWNRIAISTQLPID